MASRDVEPIVQVLRDVRPISIVLKSCTRARDSRRCRLRPKRPFRCAVIDHHRRPDKRSPRDDPSGSKKIAKRPTPRTSIGGSLTSHPSLFAVSTALSALTTWTYGIQCGRDAPHRCLHDRAAILPVALQHVLDAHRSDIHRGLVQAADRLVKRPPSPDRPCTARSSRKSRQRRGARPRPAAPAATVRTLSATTPDVPTCSS